MLTFDAIGHRYYVDGIQVPRSVTGVLHTAGLVDFSSVPPGILEAARQRGTVIHEAISLHNQQDLDVDAFAADYPDYWPYLQAWLSFTTQRDYRPYVNEHRVYSRLHDVAGTIDSLGTLDGQAVLLDFSTGNPSDVSKDLQTAGYLVLALEWSRQDDPLLAAFFTEHATVRRYGVRLYGDGHFSLDPYTDPRDIRHFITLVEAQRISASRKRIPMLEGA